MVELVSFEKPSFEDLRKELLESKEDLAKAIATNVEKQKLLNDQLDKNQALWDNNNELFEQLEKQSKAVSSLELKNQELLKKLAAFERSPIGSFTIQDERSYE